MTQKPKTHRLATGIILNRAPTLTQRPTPFEKAFYEYQARISRALHNPFPYEFYFKQGSVLEAKFKSEERAREGEAFGKGYAAKIELDDSMLTDDTEQSEKLMSRRTTAQVKSLDRRGPRNLYLLVKGSPEDRHEWRFPQGGVEKNEILHEVCLTPIFDARRMLMMG